VGGGEKKNLRTENNNNNNNDGERIRGKFPFGPLATLPIFSTNLARKRLLHRLKIPYKAVLVVLKYVRLKGNNALPPGE